MNWLGNELIRVAIFMTKRGYSNPGLVVEKWYVTCAQPTCADVTTDLLITIPSRWDRLITNTISTCSAHGGYWWAYYFSRPYTFTVSGMWTLRAILIHFGFNLKNLGFYRFFEIEIFACKLHICLRVSTL